MLPERAAYNTVSLLFVCLFGVPLRLAPPWTKGGVCFCASLLCLRGLVKKTPRMLKCTRAKFDWHLREVEAGLGTSSLGFVKWNKESAGQWKVLGLLRKQWFFQQRLGGAEGTFCRKDGGGWVDRWMDE